MTNVAPIPAVTYRWTALLPGRSWTGTVEMPDCESAWEPVTRALVEHIRLNYGVNTKRHSPIIIWRREQ